MILTDRFSVMSIGRAGTMRAMTAEASGNLREMTVVFPQRRILVRATAINWYA